MALLSYERVPEVSNDPYADQRRIWYYRVIDDDRNVLYNSFVRLISREEVLAYVRGCFEDVYGVPKHGAWVMTWLYHGKLSHLGNNEFLEKLYD